ncbi:TAXI family TRAP transporter solute-binding subunit [Halopseudomonas pelagia]|uniref:C4-dicarboxylate ABC transporter substrate-binding protein n=1 Tax=Halopseudomonas pelagia TaxID=553151 RepID=A0AA91Z507_9GAMM|nr:TAXI family TRAP transporter solute-binding subunit [Halopseudomonas pelagia]PCC98149.1 C4-dicarboxylate ABC transporter substrate-binding protein [Halopseudomonas pelagia]QFY57329.1 C4-dicarboxylate ABC transporter substrate-binding protein [Halopseudomonas pelagia]
MHVLKQAGLFVRANLWIIPLVALFVWVLFRFLDPAPPRSIVMTTGTENGGYHQFGLALKERLAEEGLEVKLVTSRGSLDNIERLTDGSGDVQLGIIQSGIEKLVDRRERDQLEGLATLYHEPLWLFQRTDAEPVSSSQTDAQADVVEDQNSSDETTDGDADTANSTASTSTTSNVTEIRRLTDLVGRRVSLGSEGSGTWAVVRSLFQVQGDMASWDSQGDGQWQTLAGRAAADALYAGELDAAFFVLPADNALIRELINAPNVELVHLSQARAFAARLPYLEDLTIPEGLLNIRRNVPDQDISLLSPVATLVGNEHFHPALTALVLSAAKEVLRDGNLLDAPGQYPAALPMDLDMSAEAEYYHESGTPFLQRYLPFWIASIVDRYIVLVIPLIVIMMPLIRSMGPIYIWRIRSRVYRWYEQLRRIDHLIVKGEIKDRLDQEIQGLHELEDELTRVDVPLSYAHELYELHLHIRYMINRLEAMRPEGQDDQSDGTVVPV